MLDENPSRPTRTIHIVNGNHAQRASLAMRIVAGGAHAEIYEDLDELVEQRPSGGAVLLEFPDNGIRGLDRRLGAAGIFLPIIVFADCPKPMHVVRAAHDGAADFLAADFSSQDLIVAYDYSQRFMQLSSADLMNKRRAEEKVAVLSPRERQILAFLLEGYSNKSMAKLLDLSPRTVEDYRLNALRKLEVTSTSAAIRIGLEADIRSTVTAMSSARCEAA